MTHRCEYYDNPRREMTVLLPARYSRVLEIGCGGGLFRSNLRLPHEYWGIEPDQVARARAARRLDRVLAGTYEACERGIPDHAFDLIVCNDVLEHIVEHEALLRSLATKLTPGGVVVASIPNVRYASNLFDLLVKRDWPYRDEGILDRGHVRFFTQASIARMAVANGYIIEELRGINAFRGGRPVDRLFCRLAALVFGRDVRFRQFGIRLRPR